MKNHLSISKEIISEFLLSNNRLKLLIVEDDTFLLNLYENQIKAMNLPVDLTTASDGWHALLKIVDSLPEIIITDLNMPDMDGFKMIKAIRDSDIIKDVDVVVVTGVNIESSIYDDLRRSVRIIEKPISCDELREIIAQNILRRI